VHVSPIIINVACFFDQHSPKLGQLASSQTVTTFPFFIISFVDLNVSELGIRERIHLGFGKTSDSLFLTFQGVCFLTIFFQSTDLAIFNNRLKIQKRNNLLHLA